LKDGGFMFYGCKSLAFAPKIFWRRGGDGPNLVLLPSIFELCTSMTSASDFRFDFSHVVNASRSFYGCESLVEIPPNVFNAPRLIYAEFMFAECVSLRRIDNDNNVDLRNLQLAAYMFQNCKSLVEIPDLFFATMARLTDIDYMFDNCESLVKVPTSIDMSTVSFAEAMFRGCRSLARRPLMMNISEFADITDIFALGGDQSRNNRK
jgi:uncharacterized protein YlaI